MSLHSDCGCLQEWSFQEAEWKISQSFEQSGAGEISSIDVADCGGSEGVCLVSGCDDGAIRVYPVTELETENSRELECLAWTMTGQGSS